MHYKTIKFNIKIPLNIHNFIFAARYARKVFRLRICAQSAPIFLCGIFQIVPEKKCVEGLPPNPTPPPPPPPPPPPWATFQAWRGIAEFGFPASLFTNPRSVTEFNCIKMYHFWIPRGALPWLKVVGTCRWTGYDFHGHQYIGTGYLNRPNWLLAGSSFYHRVASQPTMFRTGLRSRHQRRQGCHSKCSLSPTTHAHFPYFSLYANRSSFTHKSQCKRDPPGAYALRKAKTPCRRGIPLRVAALSDGAGGTQHILKFLTAEKMVHQSNDS